VQTVSNNAVLVLFGCIGMC